jgi:hypothetical protein
MNVLRSSSLRSNLDLLARATLLFALGVATGQAGQSPSTATAPQVQPVATDLPTVRHSGLELTQRQRWVF